MAEQLSVAVRNALIAPYETIIGTAPILRFYTGAIPADCATAPSGTLAALGALPGDWLNAPAAGAVTKLGTWTVTGQAAAGAGVAVGYYRIYDSAGSNCHAQGTITVTGGGGDMTVDNTSVANAQVVTVTSFTRTMGGA